MAKHQVQSIVVRRIKVGVSWGAQKSIYYLRRLAQPFTH